MGPNGTKDLILLLSFSRAQNGYKFENFQNELKINQKNILVKQKGPAQMGKFKPGPIWVTGHFPAPGSSVRIEPYIS